MKRESWIDIAKLVAILGVIIDHNNGVLYEKEVFGWSSYYSVTLFIFVMGITLYKSYSKSVSLAKVGNKILAIGVPYIVASFVYFIYYFRTFDFVAFLQRIIGFNAAAPFYYVCLYIQLLMISPILFGLLTASASK